MSGNGKERPFIEKYHVQYIRVLGKSPENISSAEKNPKNIRTLMTAKLCTKQEARV